jgi:hypothetical protein
MKEESIKYLKSIGMGDILIGRVEEIYKFYEEILTRLGDKIEDIFITDYIQSDQSRQYENILFFTSKYILEAKLFINQDDFDITPTKKRIVYIDIKKKDYDFKKAMDQSRLNVQILFGGQIECQMKASRENCDYLRDITLTHIIPNLED